MKKSHRHAQSTIISATMVSILETGEKRETKRKSVIEFDTRSIES